jgi:beta-lactamase class A
MDIHQEINAICSQFIDLTHPNGRIGLAAHNLQSGEQIIIHAHDKFPSASTIKLPVLITLMTQVENGEYALDDTLMLRRADKTGGSGLLQFLTPGLTLTIRDWAFLMMNISDNTATNVLIDQVGIKNVQQWLSDNAYEDVMLHNKIDTNGLAHDLYHFGTATPFGLMRMVTAVFQHTLLTPATCDEMVRMMTDVGKERIGRYLLFEPFGTKVPKPERLQIAGKTGSFKGTRAQTAVVWRGEGKARRGYTLAVMTDGDPAPEIWSTDAAGVLVIGRLAQILFDWGMT